MVSTSPPDEPAEGTRAWIRARVGQRHPATVQIVKQFAWAHLPAGPLRDASRRVATLALAAVDDIGDGPELTAGLRKLVEAKDCLVRAVIDDGDPL
jgi:hypothetical protein